MSEIISFLRTRIQVAVEAGISPNKIIIDPGIGFGKTAAHNLEIIRRLRDLRSLGKPILIGTSRKSFIGKVLGGLGPEERVEGTIAACLLAAERGANIVRVHDVKEVARAMRMADAILNGA